VPGYVAMSVYHHIRIRIRSYVIYSFIHAKKDGWGDGWKEKGLTQAKSQDYQV